MQYLITCINTLGRGVPDSIDIIADFRAWIFIWESLFIRSVLRVLEKGVGKREMSVLCVLKKRIVN